MDHRCSSEFLVCVFCQKRFLNLHLILRYICWNILPNHLRTLDDVKLFSKQYKQQLLDSIQTDNNYKLENAFDYFYKVKQSESAVIETSSIANTLMTILESARRARQSNTSLPN